MKTVLFVSEKDAVEQKSQKRKKRSHIVKKHVTIANCAKVTDQISEYREFISGANPLNRFGFCLIYPDLLQNALDLLPST